MTRRDFLRRAIAAALGLAVDPERLLWTPGHTIAVPSTYLKAWHWDRAGGRDVTTKIHSVYVKEDAIWILRHFEAIEQELREVAGVPEYARRQRGLWTP